MWRQGDHAGESRLCTLILSKIEREDDMRLPPSLVAELNLQDVSQEAARRGADFFP